MFKGKTIFIAPLDWGLGHATRCVPIIRQLMKENTVLLGVTPLTKSIFDEEFPNLKQIELPSYNVRYSTILPLWMKLGLDSFRIGKIIKEETKVLDKIIFDHKIDIVISDNRFGLYSKKIQSVFITHQLFLKTPVFSSMANNINKKHVLNFDEVWVPDYEDENNLSGELSHGEKHWHHNIKYIDPQSRLKDVVVSGDEKKYEFLILLSGPEPTRTELETALVEKMKSTTKRIAFVRGSKFNPDSYRDQSSKLNGVDFFDFPKKEELKELILSSQRIICRSGYSTLMDMHLLGKKELILIPTPGQTEQEYLAEYWKEKFGARVILQNEIKNQSL